MSAPESLVEESLAHPDVAPVPSRRKILLVETEEDQALYWGAVFASLGFEVLRASTLGAAAQMLAAKPSIVACSSWVTDGRGMEFLESLRLRQDLALVYLVLLTSNVGQEEVIASLRGGAHDCIDMSASYGEVRARLELAERVISLNEALHQKSAALGEALNVIQTELRAAAGLQAAMLPKTLELYGFQIHTLYQPSDLLGGDMLGLTAIDDHRIAFGLIDVVGHGTASALISCSLIRELMDRMIMQLQGPAAATARDCGKLVIEELNRRYCRLNIPGMYFTALAGVIDARRGTVNYCQAGHPNLICFDPKSGWTELEDSGYPVGLLEEADYLQRELLLQPSQVLLAVSDGLLRPLADDPGGSRELLRALPKSPQQIEPIMERLNALAVQAAGPERDDQSAMIIRRAS